MEFYPFFVIVIVFVHTILLVFCSVIPNAIVKSPPVFRTVGGLAKEIENIPWQVSVQDDLKHFCGASIISSQWLLSAAHCTAGRTRLTIRIGSSWHASGGQILNVSRIVNHPQYYRGSPNFDFSLLQLSQTLNFTRTFQPIALPDENTKIADGTFCETSGWGKTQSPYESTDFLRTVFVPIVNQDECSEAYDLAITPQMICAGYSEGGKDSCNGDSGGPLKCKYKKNGRRTLLLIGVVSFGSIPCAEAGKPGVYARVTAVRKWIETVTGI